MLYKTHTRVAQTWALGTILIFQLTGYLPRNIEPNIEAVAFFAVNVFLIYKFCIFGSEYPDLDKRISGPATKHVINALISKTITLLGAKHRSKLTHSVDMVTITFVVFFTGIKFVLLDELLIPLTVELALLNVLLIGISDLIPLIMVATIVGAYSHLAADIFTKDGVYLTVLLPKISLVPSNINLLGWKPLSTVFSTGSKWEFFVYTVNGKLWFLFLFLVAYVSTEDFVRQIISGI